MIAPPEPKEESETRVTRLEVITENGRAFTRWGCTAELSYQDNGRTLKVFVKGQKPAREVIREGRAPEPKE